jgi:transposase
LLLESAIAVAVLNPRRVRNFANGVGIDAKTDPKNPKLLASYGEVVKLQLQVVNPDAEKKLKVNQENNRLQQTRDSEIQQFIRQSLESLRKQVKEIDRRIAKSVSADLRNARMIEIL